MKHLAVSVNTEADDFAEVFAKLKELIEQQITRDIRVLTIGLPDKISEDSLVEFFKFYLKKDYLNKKKLPKKLSMISKFKIDGNSKIRKA